MAEKAKAQRARTGPRPVAPGRTQATTEPQLGRWVQRLGGAGGWGTRAWVGAPSPGGLERGAAEEGLAWGNPGVPSSAQPPQLGQGRRAVPQCRVQVLPSSPRLVPAGLADPLPPQAGQRPPGFRPHLDQRGRPPHPAVHPPAGSASSSPAWGRAGHPAGFHFVGKASQRGDTSATPSAQEKAGVS